jgi:electron transport complex protein RnfD
VFLLISFPVEMTTWPLPLSPDGLTGATMLSAMKESGLDASSIDIAQMALGNMGGSLGEVGAIALVAGWIYLTLRRIIRLVIPLSILGAVAIAAAVTGNDIAVELLSGGLLLGAIFMATDYVTSPMTTKGMLVYGILIGLITFVIRHYGSYPEGISFAILIMNGCTPLINKLTRPRVFGERRKK